jgi:hypothetical protein
MAMAEHPAPAPDFHAGFINYQNFLIPQKIHWSMDNFFRVITVTDALKNVAGL